MSVRFNFLSLMPESHILYGARTMFKNSRFDQFRTVRFVRNWLKRLFLNIVRRYGLRRGNVIQALLG